MAMRTIRPGRVPARGRRLATGTVVLLAMLGATGGLPPAAQAGSSPGPTWTRQATATHPPGEVGTMAYDAANGTVVVFTNATAHSMLGETWTWDGSAWTRHFPAIRPPARGFASMAYDPANRTVVLAGPFRQTTWTWDGSTWTKHTLAASLPGQGSASMAYDAATGTVVLFGGESRTVFGDTWTWNGSTWTKQAPAAHPAARSGALMAYDAATGTAVLLGGMTLGRSGTIRFHDTWAWG